MKTHYYIAEALEPQLVNILMPQRVCQCFITCLGKGVPRINISVCDNESTTYTTYGLVTSINQSSTPLFNLKLIIYSASKNLYF